MRNFTSKKLKIVVILAILLSSLASIAQTTVPFTQRTTMKVKGDVMFVGNHILNRVSTNPTRAANTAMTDTGNNNDMTMEYIDIDGDNTTFSSSSADLAFPAASNSCYRVAYAGLYWASIYPFERSNNSADFTPGTGPGDNVRNSDFNQAKIKFPLTSAYQSLTADQTIFDGFGYNNGTPNGQLASSFKDCPIVCYKDVTTLVQGLATVQGTYTVANIRAAKGKRNGGCSAGWVLVIVYENVSPNTPSKYISIFDGYSGVQGNNTALININGFTTLPAPFAVNANLGVGALEGDLGNTGDGLSFKSLLPVAGPETALSTANNNPSNNFFNSTITNNNAFVLTRNPASTNTLGFDLDMLPIPNPTVNGVKNTVIPNGTTGAQLKLSTAGDGYGAFLATFSVEIIEPNIYLTKRVLDAGLNDIAGQNVTMNQELTYEITYKNLGNDNAQDLVIRDVLPTNTTFTGVADIVKPAWVTVDSSVPGTLRFINTDNTKIVKNGTGGTTTIRFKVRVASNCNELTDHCSNIILNQAYATYKGVDNTNVITDDPSISGFACGAVPGPTNSLIGVTNCIYARTEILCASSITLTAGDGYASYSWVKLDPGGDIPMGTTQSITVSTPGQYKVTTTSSTPPCIGIDELITVNLSSNLPPNPLLAFADTTPLCPNNGIVMSNIFLCGLNDQRILNVGSVAGTATWSKLNEAAACNTPLPDNCPHNACPNSDWITQATGSTYTVTDKGQYRLVINNNGCQAIYYFNVTKNDANPQIAKKDILCGNPGEIKVTGLGSGYEFRLVNQTTGVQLVPTPSGATPTYGSVSTFPITTTGTYTVQIRQIGVPNPCIFTLDNIGIQNAVLTSTVTTVDKTCDPLYPASITVEPVGFTFVSPPQQYLYEVTGPVSLSSGGYVSTSPFTFNNNLAAGTYTVKVTSTSGCISTNTVTINDYSHPTATASVQQSITCIPGVIKIVAAGGKAPYSFVAYSKDGVVITPAPAYFSDGLYSVPVGGQGTYVFVVTDSSGCVVYSNAVTINSIEPVITTAFTNPKCNTGNTGTITVTATGTGITYDLLNASSTVVVPNNTSGNFINLAAGSYTVNIKQQIDTITCTYPRLFNLVAPTAISGSASVTTPFTCLNTGATITAGNASGGTGPYEYSINGTTFGTSQVFGPLGAGTYSVTVKDANGCTFTTPSMNITAPAPVTDFTINSSVVTCTATTSTVTLSAVAGGAAPFNYAITAPAASVVNNGTNAVFAGLAPGTYTFTVTDSKGCTYSKSHPIAAPTPMSVVGVKVNDVKCSGTATGAITYTVGGFVTNYNYTVANSAGGTTVAPGTAVTSGTINLTNLLAGTYTITVTNPTTNCTATAAVTIANPTTALTVTNTPVQPTCTTPTGSVTVNTTGGWGGNSYSLAGPTPRAAQSSNNFTGLAAGNYTITVTDANGCIQTSTFTLTGAVAPVLAVTGSDVCLPGTSITVAVNAGTGLAPFQFSLNGAAYANGTVANGTTYTNLAAGTYTITVRDANGCTNAATITRTINAQLTASTSLIKGITCNSVFPVLDAARIAVTIGGGGTPYQYQVSYNGGTYSALTAAGGATFNYDAALAGTYQFQITDAAGCTVITPIRTVAPKVDPEFAFGTIVDVLCNGGSTGVLPVNIDTTKGLAPFNYVVTNTDTSISYGTQTTGLPEGNYSVVLTDANGCTVTHTAYIDEPDPLTFTTLEENIQCIDDPLNPGNNIAAGKINVLTVAGGVAPYTYSLTNNFGYTATPVTTSATSNTFIILNFGIYEVVITDANGCTAVKSNIVMTSPPNELDIDVTTIVPATCTDGGSAIVEAGALITGTSYQFAILETNTAPYAAAGSYKGPDDPAFPRIATFDDLTPGATYTFVVYDSSNHCYYFESATIPATISDLVVAPLVVTDITCNGADDGEVDFNFTVGSGTNNVSYQVYEAQSNVIVPGASGPVAVTAGAGSGTVTDLAPGVYYIEFEQVDGNAGCKVASAQFTISESPVLLVITATATEKDNECTTDAGKVVITGVGGATPYTYQLVPVGDPLSATWETGNTFNGESGDYVAYIKDDNNCIKPVAVTILLDEMPEVEAVITPNTQCTAAEGSFSIDVTRTGGDVGPYTYSLNGGAFEAQADSFTYTDLASGTYSVTIKDGNGCTFTIPVLDNVIIYPPLTVTAQPTVQPACADTDGEIEAAGTGGSGNYTYELAGPVTAVAQPGALFTGLPHGSYTVTIRDTTTGCDEDVTVTLEDAIEIAPATVTIDHENVGCNGGTDGSITITLDTTLNTDIPYTYTIDGATSAAVTQSTPVFTGLAADVYDVTITSGKGCTFTDTVTIAEPSVLDSSASITTAFACAQPTNTATTGTVTVVAAAGTGTSPYTYSIDGTNYTTTNTFAVANPTAQYNLTTYVKDDNGCIDTFVLTIDPMPALTSASAAALTTAIDCDNDGEITVTAVGGSGNFSFKMEPSGTPVTTTADYDQTFPITGPGVYTFTITDLDTGCYITVTAPEVLPYDIIDVTATASTPVDCFGSTTGSLTIDVQDYTGPYTYTVFDGATTIVTAAGNTSTNPFTITNLPAGNLFVRVEASNTPFCDADSNSITIGSPASVLAPNAVMTANVTCTNDKGEITANATGGWGSYEYEFINITVPATPVTLQAYAANNILTNLVAGDYRVNVKDASGCIVGQTISLTIPPVITATVTPSTTAVLCYGDTTATITVSAVSGGQGAGNYQYVLNTYDAAGTTIVSSTGAQSSPVFANLGAGIYSVTVIDGWGCDSLPVPTTPITITQPAQLVPALSLTTGLTCLTPATLTISATGGTATPAYQYSNDNWATFTSFTSPATITVGAGNYQYLVRDANGCAAEATNNVDVFAVPALNVDLTVTEVSCHDGTNAEIAALATGGLSNYQYTLLDADNAYAVIAGPTANGTFAGLGAGNYAVRVLSVDCTITSADVLIENPDELTATPVINNILCFGDATGSITINTTGGTGDVQYAIAPLLNQFFDDNVFDNLPVGFYDILVQDANGCFIFLEDLEITEPTEITASITNVTDITCAGESDGTIRVTVTGGTGAYGISTDNVTFTPFNPATPGTYTLTGLPVGTTTVYVKDQNGCSLDPPMQQPIKPGVNLAPVASVVTTCVANAPSNTVTIATTLSANAVGTLDYSLDNATWQASNVFTIVDPVGGTYTAYVRHTMPVTNLQCTQNDTFTITGHTPIAATPSITQTIDCYGDTGEITINVAAGAGTGPFEYAIGPLFTYDTPNVFSNLVAGTYDFRVRDAIGCEFDITGVLLSQPTAALSVVQASTDEICLGDNNGTITITSSGGTPDYQVSIDGGTTFTPLGAGPFVFSNLPAATYQIVVKDANNCAPATAPADIIIAPGVDLEPVADIQPTCTNNVIGNNVFIIDDNGNSDLEYSLDGGPFDSVGLYMNIAPGPHTATIRYTINGCTQTRPFTVPTLSPITASVTAQTNVLCFGNATGAITVTATGGTGTLSYAIADADVLPLAFGTDQATGVFTGLIEGNYVVKIVDDNVGCETQVTATITEPTAALIATATDTEEICINANDGTITVTPSGGTAPYRARINGGAYTATFATTYQFTALTPSTYTVEVIDANNCTYTVPGTVTIATGVDLQPSIVANQVCNTTTITVSTNPAIAAASLTYALDGGTPQASPVFTQTGLTAGSHSIVVIHSNGCNSAPLTFNVAPVIPIVISGTSKTDVGCFGGTTGTATVTATGGTAPLTYAIAPNVLPLVYGTYQASATFTGLVAGDYVINVKDALGCELASTVINIAQPAAALTAAVTAQTNEICINANDGTITVTPANGTGPYRARINGGAYTATFATTYQFTALTPSTYTVEVIDANNCTYTVPGTVTIAPGVDLQPSIVANQVCNTTTITVSTNPAIAAASLTYALDGGTPQTSPVFTQTGLTAGSHSIVVIHSNGCNSAPLTFNVAPVIPIVISGTSKTDVGCFGGTTGTATVTATGGTAPLTYAIAPNVLPLVYGTYQASATFTGLVAGDYVINVKDALGCELASTVINIIQPVTALTSAAPTKTNEICLGANDGTITVTPSGGTAPYQARINGGAYSAPFATSFTFTALTPGNYAVELMDANGCTFPIATPVTIAPGVNIQPSIVANQVCNVTTVTVSVNAAVLGQVTYALDGGTPQASPVFTQTGLTAGSHNIVVIHSNGCNSAPLTFNVAPVIPIVISGTSKTDVGCFGGTTGTATVTATGGTAPLTYAIAPNVLPLVYGTYQASATFTGLAAGDYVINVKDALGCELASTVINIIQPVTALTSAAPTKTNEICLGANDGTITVTPSGGTAPYQARINGGAYSAPFATSFTFTALTPGNYAVELMDANGCTFPIATPVTIAPGVDLQASIAANQVCNTTTITLSANPAIAAASLTYTLDGGAPQPYTTALIVLTGLTAGSHSIVVIHSNGCNSVPLNFNVGPVIPIVISGTSKTDVGCFGGTTGTATVTATGGTAPLTYAIAPNVLPLVYGTYQASATFTGLVAGNYVINVKDALGCELASTVINVVQPTTALAAVVSHTDEQCLGDNNGTVTVTPSGGTGPYTASINGGAFTTPFTTSHQFTALGGGTYNIQVMDANGCPTSGTATVLTGIVINPTVSTTQVCDKVTVVVGVNSAVLGQVTYSLDGGPAQASNTFPDVILNPAVPHSVTVVHTQGCSQPTPQFTVASTVPVTGTVNVTNIACHGKDVGSIAINATGGVGPLQYAITWGIWPTPIYGPSNTFTDLLANTNEGYTILVKDAMGCVTTFGPYQITEPAEELTIAAVVGQHESCINAHDGTIDVTLIQGGTPPYSIALDSPNTFQPYDPAAMADFANLYGRALPYEIYVRDANGCYAKAIVTIEKGVNLVPNIQTVLSCVNNVPVTTVTATLNALITNVEYRLETAAGVLIQDFDPNKTWELAPGNYKYTVRHINGCQKDFAFTVQPRVPITVTTVLPTDTACNGGTDGTLTVTATGGTGTLSYGISPDYNMTPNPVFTGLAAGSYTVRVQDQYGCYVDFTNFPPVGEPALITVTDVMNLPEACIDDNDGAFEIEILGGVAPYATSLDANGPFVDSQTLFDNLDGGTYTVFVQDANGCTTTHDVILISPLDIDAKADVVYNCDQNTVTIVTNGAVNPVELNYTITGPKDGNNPPQTSNVFANLEDGSYTVEVINTVTGCTDTTDFTIVSVPDLALSASVSGLNQIKATVIGGEGPYQFTFDGDNMGSKNTFTYLRSGIYEITVTDSRGCTRVVSIQVNFIDVILPDVVSPDGDGNNDTWSPGNTTNYPNINSDIFDRYGRKLATLRQGDVWDGTYDGNPMPTGDYWYLVKLGDDEDRSFVGHFTIYR